MPLTTSLCLHPSIYKPKPNTHPNPNPNIGDYLLLNRNQGQLTQATLFPCPGPYGKGVLVQTTLWGNLILGPTARDVHNEEHTNMEKEEIQHFILSKCKSLVPTFDPKEVIHAFCGRSLLSILSLVSLYSLSCLSLVSLPCRAMIVILIFPSLPLSTLFLFMYSPPSPSFTISPYVITIIIIITRGPSQK